MPKKGTSKAAGTLSDKEIETLKKANKASHSASAEKKRKASLAATNAIKNTLGFSGRLTPIVQDYLRDILMEKDGSGKTYLQNYLLTFLNEAKTNPNSHASAMLAQAVFSNDLFTRLDDEINRQMAKDIQFQEFRIRQTLYNKQQEVFDCKDKLIECMCSRRVGKCWAPGTLIRLFDGSVKKVEDIEKGDILMGYDNTPRKVLSTTHGTDVMYKVHSSRDDISFVCNSAHILTVWDRGTNTLVDKPLSYFLEHPATASGYAGHYRLLRAKIEYPEVKHVIDPYILGLWLGDGGKNDAQITIGKEEKELIAYAESQGWHKHESKNAAPSWWVLGIMPELRRLNLLDNKHIPQEYKIDSIENRLSLLAGLIDSDGWHMSPGATEISLSDKVLFDDVLELIQSLGFHTMVRGPFKTSYKKDGVRIKCKDAHSVTFKGDLHLIPNKVSRKQGTKSKQNLGYGFSIEELDKYDSTYYGFTVEGDGRVLLADYTINHNTELAGRLLAKRVVRPNQHCVYINRSFDAAARQINKPLMDSLAQTDLHWTGTCSGGKLEFENGSWILILGNHNVADIDKIRGEKVALCILDESGHMKNMKQLMQEVISPAMMDYEDSQLFMIGTPPRVPNTYAQEMWNNASVTHFHWTYLDNPFLPNRENILDEVCKLYSVEPDSPFIKREYQGDMNAYDYEAMPFHNNIKYDKLPEGPYDRAYIGVDYGYGDEAAVVSLVVKGRKMYITDCWAQSKKTVTELCDEIQRQLDNLKKLPLANTQPQIICDTNEGAITAELYYQRHMPNVATAYKYDKYYALCMLSEWVKNGTILTPQDSYINYEAEHTVWKRDPETDKMENELDDDVFHPNALMAVLYVSRQFAYEVLGLTTENKTAKSIIGE